MKPGKKKKLLLCGVLAAAALAGGIAFAVWWFSPEPLLQLDPAQVTSFTIEDGARGTGAKLESPEVPQLVQTLFSGAVLQKRELNSPRSGFLYAVTLRTADGSSQHFTVNGNNTIICRGFLWKNTGREIDLNRLYALIPEKTP